MLAPAIAQTGYSKGAELGPDDWRALFAGIDAVAEIARARALVVAVHPHWGTAIERPHQIERFLEGTDHALCLDTGHIALGGADPVKVARDAGSRVRHVHLKDVDERLAVRVRERSLSYEDAANNVFILNVDPSDLTPRRGKDVCDDQNITPNNFPIIVGTGTMYEGRIQFTPDLNLIHIVPAVNGAPSFTSYVITHN